jgi:4-amino-4-deoxychorismate lyase
VAPRDLVVTLDGSVGDAASPLLRPDDLALVRGDGVFEGLLVTGGAVRDWDAHLARMRRSADAMDIPLPEPARWRAAVDTALAAYGPADELVLRLFCTRGPESGGPVTAFVRLSPVAERVGRQRAEGVSVVLLERGLEPVTSAARWQLRGVKTLSYATNMAALREAARRGADDAIYLSPAGELLEAPVSSVVLLGPGRRMRTPGHELGILPGTTQQALFRAAAARGWDTGYATLGAEELHAAEAVWLVGSVRLVAAVRSVDGVALAKDGPPATLGRELLDAAERDAR